VANSDLIEKRIVLPVTPSRVWRALADADEFGTWFGMRLEGPFVEGAPARGKITHPGYEHLNVDMLVEGMEPERYFAFRWHPYAIDPAVDYSKEPTTLVEFRLGEVPVGTELTVLESGFSRIPAGRRAEAYRMHEQGWTQQMQNIERHLLATPSTVA
jgi:uncharacterized protein YndB with AHSA1/START domain